MIETLMDLKARHSCRKFKQKQIKESILKQILEAGSLAASGKGLQSPIMIVIQDPTIINELSKINAEIRNKPNFDNFFKAPTVVAVLADKNIATHVYDGSLVIGNLMNAAYALNIGSCWIHRAKETFERPEGKAILQKLKITGDYEGIGFCILGYPENNQPANQKQVKKDYIYRL